MSTNPRQKKHLKKITTYIVLLVLLTFLAFLINSIFFAKGPLFVSPLGKGNSDSSKVEKTLRDNNILFSKFSILPDSSYLIDIQNNGQVRLSSKKDIKLQISSLQRILRELTIEGKPFKNIDFRFEEPVLTF